MVLVITSYCSAQNSNCWLLSEQLPVPCFGISAYSGIEVINDDDFIICKNLQSVQKLSFATGSAWRVEEYMLKSVTCCDKVGRYMVKMCGWLVDSFCFGCDRIFDHDIYPWQVLLSSWVTWPAEVVIGAVFLEAIFLWDADFTESSNLESWYATPAEHHSGKQLYVASSMVMFQYASSNLCTHFEVDVCLFFFSDTSCENACWPFKSTERNRNELWLGTTF